MQVRVTERHIEEGRPGDCERCAVALAVKDAFEVDKSYVDDGQIQVHRDGVWHGFDAPFEVEDFIFAFDQGKPVQPFTFDLSDPEEDDDEDDTDVHEPKDEPEADPHVPDLGEAGA